MIIAVLGVGEAGGILARDLLAAGMNVRGWDPNPRQLPTGLLFADSNPAAAAGADIVLSVNWASVAVEVAAEVAPVLQPNQLYADLNTASPQNKRDVAAIIEQTGALFVDTAVMAPVPPKGLGTPVYASGSGAALFAAKMSPLGMPVTVLDGEAGNAATHKLIRSIMYKGVAAVVMECLEAAEVLHMGDYARAQMMTMLRDELMIDRLVDGSKKHARRRIHEMEAVVELLDSIGVSAFTSRASVEKLKEVME
ncbi:MAG: NAD(P)-dependent oxidoreductase [Anaerolineales bacterium]|nr:NAD(P)-dependent oxidoreductase [Anaerolineales bacterium]MCA9978524.1 NAD(P)-dependent oxidoreductase [Anaerolineales bacterium]